MLHFSQYEKRIRQKIPVIAVIQLAIYTGTESTSLYLSLEDTSSNGSHVA